MHAGVGQDVRSPVGLRVALWRDAHDREVRGAAADVGDQRKLLALHAGFVVERGGDRLELKMHLLEAAGPRDRLQLLLREPVRLRVVVDEADRPAKHHAADGLAAVLLREREQVREKLADDVAKRVLAVADLRRLLQQAAAQNALERAQQPPLAVPGVGRNGLAPELHARLLEVEEDRARDRPVLLLQGQQARACRVGQAHGGIGGAEVNRDHGNAGPLVQLRGREV